MKMKSAKRGAMFAWAAVAMVIVSAGCEKSPPPKAKVELAPATKNICFGVGICDKEDPREAAKAAAEAAKKAVGAAPVKAVLISECFEDKERKEQVLAGVTSVFDAAVIYGGATYGSFAQVGVMIDESVAVMAIAGDDIDVAAACLEGLGTAKLTPAEHEAEIREKLVPAGAELAKKLARTDASRLMIVIADAHSPKNGPLVEGVRSVAGDGFPIIGGSANKNAGQTFVYYQGKMLADAAVGLMLSGDFKVALSGRSAKDNAAVIATAREAAAEALAKLAKAGAKPAGIFVFDCAGRKGKLDNVADELAAIQDAVGSEVPLFGSYNAGEVGPADVAEKTPGVLSSGMGWHIMVGAIGW